MSSKSEWPQEGELVVCTVKSVVQNGAYLNLDGYDREGFVFIGEIAAGWVKNIRGHVRVGQRVVGKVTRVRKDRQSVDLSLKSVNEERRREALQAWKNENRARQLLKITGERSGWEESRTAEMATELTEAFGTLYGAFEEAVIDPEALQQMGYEGDWITVFVELAVENIVPPFVAVRGHLEIMVPNESGIEVISNALAVAEEKGSEGDEVEVTCHYDGAPHYRVEIRAPDYKSAEVAWDAVEQAVLPAVKSAGGTASAERI